MNEKTMNENQLTTLHKEIDLIEGAIERMARNSFMIKGWSLSMLALCATLSSFPLPKTALILLAPIVGFWWLDSYYLRLERAFRKVYEDRISKRTIGDWETDLYVVNCGPFLSKVQKVVRIMFSSSTFPFYGTLVLMLIFVAASYIEWTQVFSYIPHFCGCKCH